MKHPSKYLGAALISLATSFSTTAQAGQPINLLPEDPPELSAAECQIADGNQAAEITEQFIKTAQELQLPISKNGNLLVPLETSIDPRQIDLHAFDLAILVEDLKMERNALYPECNFPVTWLLEQNYTAQLKNLPSTSDEPASNQSVLSYQYE